MSKCAQIAKVTALLRGLRAKLGLVLLRMVKRFDAVVSLGAPRPLGTLVGLSVAAHLRGVCAQEAPLILLVIVEAFLLIVASLASAGLRLEGSQVKQDNTAVLVTFAGGCS